MKIYIFIALTALFAITSGVFVPPRPGHKQLLGAKECTWGPSYWCQNLTSAAGCKAVKHCIQTVWVHKQLPPDTSSVCQTCLDMVKQARDQLLSNDTQELVKEVFEGSCALLHVKPIVKECDKVADEFIPELIDTLASEMNPQVVCSVAGLCNNDRIHRMLQDAERRVKFEDHKLDPCNGCHTVIGLMEDKFNKMSRDEVLQSFLAVCGNFGSFSDGCSNIVVTYFNEIYQHLLNNLNSNDVCLMAGECSAQFHQHAKVEITPISHIGYVPVGVNDDLPCELCEQLVGHLRELLVANTTEDEFKTVLNGICKQTREFSQECLSLVNQYYDEVYSFLVRDLNSTVVCNMMGICKVSKEQEVGPIVPLLPVQTGEQAFRILSKNPVIKAGLTKNTVRIIPPVNVEEQLPIDLLVPPHSQVYNSEVCVFCEYFLHYIQEAITSPKTEEEIKDIIERACTKLPNSVNNTCYDFVNTYEPALVAILAQEIDPSQICPMIRVCPEQKDVDIFMHVKGEAKCPLCLLAVGQLESELKDKRTEASIKSALDKLCIHLPSNLKEECDDFVTTYTDELVEMLIADLKPQEVCVYLKLCTDSRPGSTLPPYLFTADQHGDIETNIIPDNTVNGMLVEETDTVRNTDPQCIMCEFVMKEIDDQLKDKKTDVEIKNVVTSICNVMPRSVKTQCNDFVNQYADTIIQLLIQALEPEEICTMMKLCTTQMETLKLEIVDCPICELAVEAMEKILDNPNIDHDVEHVLEKTCRGLPIQYRTKCEQVIQKYGSDIFNLITQHHNPQHVCQQIGLCSEMKVEILIGTSKCTYGPSYWCQSEENADKCGARYHCESKVWGGGRPKRSAQLEATIPCRNKPGKKGRCTAKTSKSKELKRNTGPNSKTKVWGGSRLKRGTNLLGRNHCTWGPGYWCESEANADECGSGARAHCETKVWGGPRPKRSTTLVGSNHCTRGPGYWCQNEATADECGSGARTHCETKVWGGPRPKRSTNLLGSNHCTWGPGYWCESESNADECGSGARAHCESKVWGGPRPKRSTPLVGSNRCTWGPGYWCESESHADECGSGARSHCESKVWGGPRPKRSTPLVGSNRCTWGPGYWCESESHADECGSGARSHCESKVWGGPRPKRSTPLVGSNRCTWGPGYWCESESNADECGSGARAHCESKVWGGPRPKRSTPLVGSNRCTWGPEYWCESELHADECGSGARAHCESKVWGGPRPKRSTTLVGSNHCSRGPGYWCQNEATADECGSGARSHCETKVWGGPRPKRSTNLVGSNHCTRGPGYWCQNEATADECGSGARSHCETKVWGGPRPKRNTNLLGSDHCTWGPGYWCESEANADECGARQHCESKVWGASRPKRSPRTVGTNRCTSGPVYWCQTEATANECGPAARRHCETRVWGNKISKRNAEQLLGADHCTWGPSYWCESEKNADECEARPHCEEKVWFGTSPKST